MDVSVEPGKKAQPKFEAPSDQAWTNEVTEYWLQEQSRMVYPRKQLRCRHSGYQAGGYQGCVEPVLASSVPVLQHLVQRDWARIGSGQAGTALAIGDPSGIKAEPKMFSNFSKP